MIIIRTPFDSVAVNFVGLIRPTSEKGNKFIPTMVDFATQYAEAVAPSGIGSI